MRIHAMLTAIFAAAIVFSACEKPPGPGGKAMITGRIWASDFDNQQYRKISEGYSSGDRVYISYGNSTTISNDTRTGPDGTFEFKYLNKGRYRIFVNSIDTSWKFKGNDTQIPIIKDVEVKDAKQTVDVGTIKINK